MKSTRIVFTGGGTGGHVYPLMAVAEEIEKIAIDGNLFLKLYYAGPRDQFSAIAVKNGLRFVSIISSKIRRYAALGNIIDIPKFFISVVQALIKLFFIMPDAVFSKGGPGSLPIVFAAWWYRIPVVVHESDSVPGISNLFSSRFATRVAVSFEEAAKFFPEQKTLVTGNPVRYKLFSNIPTKEIARKQLGAQQNAPTILIIGGSQGAARINDFVINNLKAILEKAQIIHQFGKQNYSEQSQIAQSALKEVSEDIKKEHPYTPIAYFEKEDEIQTAYAAADVVISRAGAGSIFEIAAFKKPAILIPLLESANDHQRSNAYSYATKTGSVVIEEENLLATIFLKELDGLLKDSTRQKTIADASWKFFKSDAAQVIAQEILRLAR